MQSFCLFYFFAFIAINFIFQPLMVNVVSSYPQTAEESWGSSITHQSISDYKYNFYKMGEFEHVHVLVCSFFDSDLHSSIVPSVSASCRAPSEPKMCVWWLQLGHWKTLMFCTRPRTCRDTKHGILTLFKRMKKSDLVAAH